MYPHIKIHIFIISCKTVSKVKPVWSLQVDEMYREAPIKNGLFDYIEFTRILKHGAKDKDEQ